MAGNQVLEWADLDSEIKVLSSLFIFKVGMW